MKKRRAQFFAIWRLNLEHNKKNAMLLRICYLALKKMQCYCEF